MGLRALAYYLDPAEATVVHSVLNAPGIFALRRNELFLRMRPEMGFALGGYCVEVSEYDLEDAAAVLAEARANPLNEGEILVTERGLLDRALSLFVGILAAGAPTTIRTPKWLPEGRGSQN